MNEKTEQPSLWGDNELKVEQTWTSEFGNLDLAIARSAFEVSVEYKYRQDRYVNEARKEVARYRVVVDDTDHTLTLRPSTADRNVVVRPIQTVRVPDGAKVRLFIGTPIWVQGFLAGGEKLFDLPSEILSDTWFGKNTREGEVCYANQTQARLSLEKLSQRPERLITPVTIENHGGDTLVIERINLPLPQLSIYETGASPWTQAIELRRSGRHDMGQIVLSARPPAEYPDARLVSEPRRHEDEALVERALGMLFDERRSM